jgi:hypothetical protein
MIKGLAKLILFYTAYTPLLLILIVKSFKSKIIPSRNLNPDLNIGLSIAILCLLVLSMAVLLMKLLLREISQVAGHRNKIEILENLNSENLTFLLTYAIPVIIEVKGLRDLVALAIIFMVILFVYMNSDLLMYNIFFNIFGYNIYKVLFEEKERFLIHRGKLSKGKYTLYVNEFHGDILVEETIRRGKNEQ